MLLMSQRKLPEGRVQINPEGTLVLGADTESMRKALAAVVPRHRSVVINMAGITKLDAAGIGVLVGAYVAGQASHAEVRLSNVSGPIRATLELVHLAGVLSPRESCLQTAA